MAVLQHIYIGTNKTAKAFEIIYSPISVHGIFSIIIFPDQMPVLYIRLNINISTFSLIFYDYPLFYWKIETNMQKKIILNYCVY